MYVLTPYLYMKLPNSVCSCVSSLFSQNSFVGCRILGDILHSFRTYMESQNQTKTRNESLPFLQHAHVRGLLDSQSYVGALQSPLLTSHSLNFQISLWKVPPCITACSGYDAKKSPLIFFSKHSGERNFPQIKVLVKLNKDKLYK